ncbi:unnamed protein product [Discosporangium mesarthrocarpum]
MRFLGLSRMCCRPMNPVVLAVGAAERGKICPLKKEDELDTTVCVSPRVPVRSNAKHSDTMAENKTPIQDCERGQDVSANPTIGGLDHQWLSPSMDDDLPSTIGSKVTSSMKPEGLEPESQTRHCGFFSPFLTLKGFLDAYSEVGDLVAQSFEYIGGRQDGVWHNREALWRSGAVAFDGVFINGPLLHYTYGLLEKWSPEREWQQVIVDIFVIDPLFAFIFIWSTGLIELRSVENDIIPTIRYLYGTMVLSVIIVGLMWAPLQVYMFQRFSPKYRVLQADLIDIVWTCVVSFFSHDLFQYRRR